MNLKHTENKMTKQIAKQKKKQQTKCICSVFFRRPFASTSLLGVCGKTQAQSHTQDRRYYHPEKYLYRYTFSNRGSWKNLPSRLPLFP